MIRSAVVVALPALLLWASCVRVVDLRGPAEGEGEADVPVFSDPLGDGATRGALLEVDRALFVGPNTTGDGVARLSDDASAAALVPFSTSLGAPGCTTTCGPDGEDGPVVLLTDGVHVVAGGRQNGDQQFVYVSAVDADADAWDFIAVDLGPLAGRARTLTALAEHRGDAVLTLNDDANAPIALALTDLTEPAPTTVARCGEDAADACGLAIDDVVDDVAAVASFSASLFVAHSAGVARARGVLSADGFDDVTPDEMGSAIGPQSLVVDRSDLVLARTSDAGAELWRCANPCELDDWTRASAFAGEQAALVVVVDADNSVLLATVDGDRVALRRFADGAVEAEAVRLPISRVQGVFARADDVIVLGNDGDSPLQVLTVAATLLE